MKEIIKTFKRGAFGNRSMVWFLILLTIFAMEISMWVFIGKGTIYIVASGFADFLFLSGALMTYYITGQNRQLIDKEKEMMRKQYENFSPNMPMPEIRRKEYDIITVRATTKDTIPTHLKEVFLTETETKLRHKLVKAMIERGDIIKHSIAENQVASDMALIEQEMIFQAISTKENK